MDYYSPLLMQTNYLLRDHYDHQHHQFICFLLICQYHYKKHFHKILFLGAFHNSYIPQLYTANVIIKTLLRTTSFL
ncbi:hypothetical protein EI555_003318 [Monodon monoceros]|uniref:Uncharacterized protein n=1 Tax=Monodon monoceros TaxID=40151 RepID=A0A4V5P639_MONMO|nr:hypothetical protein EI555_003318 [Monodon monoceros]